MGLNRNRLLAFGILAIVGGAAAVIFSVPLGALLLVGVLLVCPLMMMGMHDGAHGQHDSPTGSTPDDHGTTDPRPPS